MKKALTQKKRTRKPAAMKQTDTPQIHSDGIKNADMSTLANRSLYAQARIRQMHEQGMHFTAMRSHLLDEGVEASTVQNLFRAYRRNNLVPPVKWVYEYNVPSAIKSAPPKTKRTINPLHNADIEAAPEKYIQARMRQMFTSGTPVRLMREVLNTEMSNKYFALIDSFLTEFARNKYQIHHAWCDEKDVPRLPDEQTAKTLENFNSPVMCADGSVESESAESHVVKRDGIEYLFDMIVSYYTSRTERELFEEGNKGVRLGIIKRVLANRNLSTIPESQRQIEKQHAAMQEERERLEKILAELRRTQRSIERAQAMKEMTTKMLNNSLTERIAKLTEENARLCLLVDLLHRDIGYILQPLGIGDKDILRTVDFIKLLLDNYNERIDTLAQGEPNGTDAHPLPDLRINVEEFMRL